MGGGAVGDLPWPHITWVIITTTMVDMAMAMDMAMGPATDIMEQIITVVMAMAYAPLDTMETTAGARAMDATILTIHTIHITIHIITHPIDGEQLEDSKEIPLLRQDNAAHLGGQAVL